MDRNRAVEIINLLNSNTINEYSFQAIIEYVLWRNAQLENKFTSDQLNLGFNYLTSNPHMLYTCINGMRSELARQFNIYLLYDTAGKLRFAY